MHLLKVLSYQSCFVFVFLHRFGGAQQFTFAGFATVLSVNFTGAGYRQAWSFSSSVSAFLYGF